MYRETPTANVNANGDGAARLLIADDHAIVRSGLRGMLQGELDLEVVGEVTDGQEVLQVCRRLQPDLVLMDVQMPRRSGLAATRELKRELPDTKVLVLTIYESPKYLSEALKAGAAGYVLKDATEPEVLGAVRRVLRGEPLPTPQLTTKPLRRPVKGADAAIKPPPKHMTPREFEIMQLVAEGRTNREIAETLSVSASTVKVHIEHIISKLAVADRTQAVVRAIELGYLPIPE